MTGWIIFGIILLVLILILVQSASVTAVYDRDPELRIKIAFITIVRVPPDPEKERKKAARKAAKEARKARKETIKEFRSRPAYNRALLADAEKREREENGEEPDEPGNEKTPSDDKAKNEAEGRKTAPKDAKSKKVKAKKKGMPKLDIDMILDYIRSASPPLKRLFKKIRIRDVYVDWVVGSDDAAKTALKYGGLCAALYSTAEILKSFFDTQIKEINIEADFDAEKDDIFAYITLKLRICTALGCAIWLLFRMARTYLKYNSTEKKVKKRPVRAEMKG